MLLCEYVSVFVCVCIYIYIHIYIHTYTYACTSTTSTYIHTYINTYTDTNKSAEASSSISGTAYTHTHIHTYTHTHIPRNPQQHPRASRARHTAHARSRFCCFSLQQFHSKRLCPDSESLVRACLPRLRRACWQMARNRSR